MSATGQNEEKSQEPQISLLAAKENHQVYLGLGSNISPEGNLLRAMGLLREQATVEQTSQVWETPPSGANGPNFLNAVVRINTPLIPSLLKSLVLRRIEVVLKRVRTSNKNSPRTIDLDILIYDGLVMDPKVWTHAFVAVPLADLIPDYRNPATQETIREAAQRLGKITPVKPRPDIRL